MMQTYDEFFEEENRIVEMESQLRKSHIETTEDIYRIVNVLVRDMDLFNARMIRIEAKIDGPKEN